MDTVTALADRRLEALHTPAGAPTATKTKRREADHERRVAVAKAFLGDPSRRALAHPTPTPKRCVVETEDGRVFFDADSDTPPARDVPAEAHRRFRADLRAKRESNL